MSHSPLVFLMQDVVTTVYSRKFLEDMSHPRIYCGGVCVGVGLPSRFSVGMLL